jgi:folate-binding protein YgfZ
MTDHRTEPAARCVLDDYALLRFRGADAAKFLQGQISNDIDRLAPQAILRAGLHNPQGRTLALLWLAMSAEGDILALLPRQLAAGVLAQLQRYVLRARLTIADDSSQYQVVGHWRGGPAALSVPWWRLDADRTIALYPAGGADPPGIVMTRADWRALDIAAGVPQVAAATAGLFVAQMLNLDCIDAVSFTKGCYTGQEVIARAHYRGRVKRRMQRFETLVGAQLAPGDAGQLDDGRAFRVVDSLTRVDGRSEFLAVAPISAASQESAAESGTASTAAASVLQVNALPLPYALPE